MFQAVIVDDNKLLADSLAALDIWNQMDIKVVDVRYNGVAGKEAILRYCPDLILSDIRLPGMDGLELISVIHDCVPDARVIFMSAYSDFDYLRKAIHLRAEDYLLKPFSTDELKRALANTIAELQKERSLVSEASSVEYQNSDTVIQPIINYVRNRLDTRITAEEVAEAFCMSTSKLDRLIKEHTGAGFRELRIALCIEKAKKLLMDVRLSVEEVASLVGYKNYVTFYRAFSRECGCAPSEYRDNLLKKHPDSEGTP